MQGAVVLDEFVDDDVVRVVGHGAEFGQGLLRRTAAANLLG